MACIKPVGINSVLTTGVASVQTSTFLQKSDTLRVVTEGAGCHVAFGTNPTATEQDYYIPVTDPGRISLGPVTTLRVVGITTGAGASGNKTLITFPEGMASPFGPGDAVSLTVDGVPAFDFSHKIVNSVNNSAGVGGAFSGQILVDYDSSSITAVYNQNNYASMRTSVIVAVKTQSGSGLAFIQQVQVS